MGASASLQPNAKSNTLVSRVDLTTSSTASLTSGFISLEEELSHTTSVTGSASTGYSAMGPKVLTSRPSQMIRSITKQEEMDELKQETEIVNKTPALGKAMDGFEECKKSLTDESKKNSQHFRNLNKLLNKNIIEMFTRFGKDEQRTVMGNRLARIGFVPALVEYYNLIIDEEDILAITNPFVEEAHREKDNASLLVLAIREILWNFSDSSHRFSEEISETDLFSKLANDLDGVFDDGLEQLEDDEDLFAFSSAVGILHNCARNENIDKEKFRDAKAIDNLLPFLQSKLIYVKMITLLALGNMITEDQVDKLAADTDVFDFLLEAIKNAIRSEERKEHGFHLSELVGGLASLAQSDKNKELIMAKKPLPMIRNILEGKHVAEVLAAVKLVWELAFLESNKTKIVRDKALMSSLEKLKSENGNIDYDIKNAARSAWFVIVGKDERIKGVESMISSKKRSSSLAPSIRGAPAADIKPGGKHIMFSYNWGDKETVLKIYHILSSEGLPIWIDIKEMNKYTNLLEGMAKAVEEAYVILVCFSEKYKNSQNCRTEADYAYTKKKEIIPLKMQRGYNPDGWLGALIGARLFIEFSPKYDFDVKMTELKNTLPKRPTGVSPQPMPSPVVQADPPPVVIQRSSSIVPRKVSEWLKHDVDHWAAEHNMEGKPYIKVRQMTGEQLRFVFNVQSKAPDTFYSWCEKKLGLNTIEEIMRFSNAVEAVVQHL